MIHCARRAETIESFVQPRALHLRALTPQLCTLTVNNTQVGQSPRHDGSVSLRPHVIPHSFTTHHVHESHPGYGHASTCNMGACERHRAAVPVSDLSDQTPIPQPHIWRPPDRPPDGLIRGNRVAQPQNDVHSAETAPKAPSKSASAFVGKTACPQRGARNETVATIAAKPVKGSVKLAKSAKGLRPLRLRVSLNEEMVLTAEPSPWSDGFLSQIPIAARARWS